jgi:tRNA(Ile)-lysidine synthase
VHDASNFDLRFERNRVRHDVLPSLSERLGVDVAARLAALADDLRVEADLADAGVARMLESATHEELPVAVVRAAGAAGSRIVHAWLARSGVRPRRAQAEALVRLARGERPSGRVDLEGTRVERRYGVLARCPVEPGPPPGVSARAWRAPGSVDLGSGVRLSADLAPAEGLLTAASRDPWVDADRIEGQLEVRSARPGDRIRLRAGHRKLSDVFIDARVPREERWRLAVVTRGADIVWVPGVVVASSVAPHPRTDRFMRLRAERADCRSAGSMVKMQGLRVEFG